MCLKLKHLFSVINNFKFIYKGLKLMIVENPEDFNIYLITLGL